MFQSITTWDFGNQLTYPVKYIDPGYKDEDSASSKSKEEAKSTGFEVKEYTKYISFIFLLYF